MKNESTYRIAVIVLLAGILAVQLAGLLKTPRTKSGLPIVSVAGTVGVDVQNSSFDVNVENTSLDVDVQNPVTSVEIEGQPIEVEIQRN